MNMYLKKGRPFHATIIFSSFEISLDEVDMIGGASLGREDVCMLRYISLDGY